MMPWDSRMKALAPPPESHVTVFRKGREPLKIWWRKGQPMPGAVWLFLPLAVRRKVVAAERPVAFVEGPRRGSGAGEGA